MSATDIRKRNNVNMFGNGDQILMFAHGFGCNQTMWRFVTNKMKSDYTIVTFDYVGCGDSELAAYDSKRYATLDGYATDITEILSEMDLSNVTFIGHSVSSMTGMLAAISAPERIRQLVMLSPSPYYLNDLPAYEGGFEGEDLKNLIDMMAENYIGWANYLAPLVMGSRASQEAVDEMIDSFCSADPLMAKSFAIATFFSDFRYVLPDCQVPTLVLQSREDALAQVKVGEYVSAHLPDSSLRVLDTQGHCIHMTAPDLVETEIRRFVSPH